MRIRCLTPLLPAGREVARGRLCQWRKGGRVSTARLAEAEADSRRCHMTRYLLSTVAGPSTRACASALRLWPWSEASEARRARLVRGGGGGTGGGGDGMMRIQQVKLLLQKEGPVEKERQQRSSRWTRG